MATANSAGTEGQEAPMTIDQAFDNAVSEVEGEGPVGDGDGTGDEPASEATGDEGTGDGDTSTDDADGQEQQTDKGEGAPDKAPDAAPAVALPEYLQGSGNEELGRIYSQLPEEARGYINKVLTPKFQEAAAQRQFLQSFRDDPEAAANAVLDQIQGQRRQQAQSDEEAINSQAAIIEKELTDGGIEAANAKVQARALAKANYAAMAPARAEEQRRQITAIGQEAERQATKFQTDFPDCKDDQPLGQRVAELMDAIHPAQSTTQYDYLKMLRTIALSEQGTADGVKKAVDKMAKGAKAAAAKGPKAANEGAVKPGPPGKLLTIDESIELAARGETVGRGIVR